MTALRCGRVILSIGSVVLLAACASVDSGTPATEAAGAAAAPAAPATGTAAIASGAVGDSLEACLARIPKDASTGQRMIAEQSCKRDETDRKAYQAVPSAK
jgi:hypothetical protein